MLNLSLVRLFRKDYLTSMRIILTNVWLKHKGISELKIFSFQAWSWYDMNINWTTLIMINMNRIISSVQIPADQTLKVTNLDKINNIFSRPIFYWKCSNNLCQWTSNIFKLELDSTLLQSWIEFWNWIFNFVKIWFQLDVWLLRLWTWTWTWIVTIKSNLFCCSVMICL